MANVCLDTTALGQLHGEQKALLDTIDGLRKHGVGRFVDLPQIIVVGDQSSGKSSVLEAISRVRFPVDDKLCTRFPTELVLRTNDKTRIEVHIQRHDQSPVNGGDVPFSHTAFNKEALPEIIKSAKQKLLPGDAGFSEDVLRVEISGPDVPSLTLVDLPGFYHSEDDTQSAAGRAIVNRLAERYMEKQNSIILAIVSARNQLIMQGVLSKLKFHDKNKERTLGIITKPDMLNSNSNDEESFLRLMKNEDPFYQLSLGWHVLRNRSEFENGDSDDERDNKETAFFQSGPWSTVPSKNRGIDRLRKKLSNVLLSHIKKNLPSLIEQIQSEMNTRHQAIKKLGEPRSSLQQLRSHLDKIASQFHTLALHAVEGNYSDPFFGGLFAGPEDSATKSTRRIKKFRALVRDLNRVFAHVLSNRGSRRIILPRSKGDESDSTSNFTEAGVPLYLADLIDPYDFEWPQEVSFEKIAEELEDLSSANQGNEFPGTPNDRLAVELFRDQSQPWEKIAQFHVRLVLDMSRHFVNDLVGYIVSPSAGKTFSAILADVVDPFFEKKSQVLEQKVNELLHHYRTGQPQPLDTEFRMLLTARRRKNLEAEVLDRLLRDQPEIFKDEALEKLRQATDDINVSKFGVEGLIEKSETYYEMALRTFTDNVVILAIENCLIQEIPNIFTTEMVNQMDDAELDRLASESDDIRDERAQLQREHDALKEGLKYCNRYRERGIPFKPPVIVHLDDVPSRSASTVGRVASARSPSATSRSTAVEAESPGIPESKSHDHGSSAHKPTRPTDRHKAERIPYRSGSGASLMKQAPEESSSAGLNPAPPASVLPPGDLTVGRGFSFLRLGSGSPAESNNTTSSSSPQTKSWVNFLDPIPKPVSGAGSPIGASSSSVSVGAPGVQRKTASGTKLFSFATPPSLGPVNSTILPKSNLTFGSTVAPNAPLQSGSNPLGFPPPKQAGRQVDPKMLQLARRLPLKSNLHRENEFSVMRLDHPCPQVHDVPYFSIEELRLAFLDSPTE